MSSARKEVSSSLVQGEAKEALARMARDSLDSVLQAVTDQDGELFNIAFTNLVDLVMLLRGTIGGPNNGDQH